jgi:hypothetical protein
MAEDRYKPYRIQEPIVAEDIDFNFDVLFRRVAELLDDGVSVLAVRRGGTGIDEYVVGDLLVAVAPDTLGRLPAVAAGFALVSAGVGTEPVWGKIVVTGATSQLSGFTAKGDIITFDGTNPLILPRGNDGEVLKSSASATAGLEWGTVAGGSDSIDSILTDGDLVLLDDLTGSVLYSTI